MNLIIAKTKQIVIVGGLLILTMVSCRDNSLDITPNGQITLAEVFSNEKYTEAFLNTTYTFVPYYFFSYGGTMLGGATDEAQYVYGPARDWNTGSLRVNQNGLNDNYPNLWKGIRHVNIFIENIDKTSFTNSVTKSRLKAEALTLRAFYYFELVKQYGPMPIIERDFSADFDFANLTRPSFQQNIDFIVRDCNEAIANANLPLRLTLEVERGRFSKAVAYMIRSQALLFNASPLWNPSNEKAKWEAAALASKQALDVLTAGNEYQLAADYSAYFLNQADLNATPRDRETIYETRISSQTELITQNNIPSKLGAEKAGASPTQELVDSYEMQATGELGVTGYSNAEHTVPIINAASGYQPNNPYIGRDPRFYATVWYNGAIYDNINGSLHTIETFIGGKDQLVSVSSGVVGNTLTGYYIRKFVDPKLQARQNSNARWKKYRLAELYLNYAEAENEATGANSLVYAAVNQVRSRVQMPVLPQNLTQEQMRNRIRRERRVELAFEEHRFWDVRRWKILDQTDVLTTGMEITKQGSAFTYTRFVSDRRNAFQQKFLIYPIPLTDVSIVKDFQLNQNPGW